MRLRCHLPIIRGERSLRALALESGVNAGELSRIETGKSLPRCKDIEALERAYGASILDWYDSRALLAFEFDDDAAESVRARLRTSLLPPKQEAV